MSESRRVVSVVHFPEFGGPHNQLLRLHLPLKHRNWSLQILLPEGQGSKRLVAEGANVRNLSLGRVRAVKDVRTQVSMVGRLPLDLWNLARVFRQERPDVVQLSSLMNPHAAYVARFMGIPVVWQIVDTRPPMKVRQLMMSQIGRLADVVMPIGEAVRDAHPGASKFGNRCVLFFPPVDLDEFTPKGPTTLRVELGILPESHVVTVIGNINPQKGHEYFLQAAASVAREHPDVVFVIAGHVYDNHRGYYERLVAQAQNDGLELGRNLHFLGSRTDIPNILRASNLFALASVPNSEGMPTVILEAMGCGVPVVASNVGSVSEAVVQGETGYVVPSLDVAAMADRMNQLLADDGLRETMAAASRSRVEERFSLDQYVDVHLQAYSLAIANQEQRRGPLGLWRAKDA